MDQAQQHGNAPVEQMGRIPGGAPMPLLIALGLVLKVHLQDGRIDLLEGDLLLTEILKKLPTYRTMALDGVGTVPLLV
jgi:hypothetical protein